MDSLPCVAHAFSVPIKSVARELDLPLHEIPTFTGWSPPAVFNLIVAVSFGLKVPPRLLQQATYGGLNLHPSLLPEYVGQLPNVEVVLVLTLVST